MSQQVSKLLSPLLVGLFILIISLAHLWQLSSLPRGLYVDESSIGLNAALIAKTGHDEYNQAWPVYFKAFGEYKNPIYVYTAALSMKLFGISVLSLRLTSFFFFSLFLIGLFYLSQALFKQGLVTFFGLLAASFLPWFFPLSRIAFEVISQLTLVTWALWAIHRTYQPNQPIPSPKPGAKLNYWPYLAGFLLGLSIYSYSTARLLSLTALFVLCLCYAKREYWKRTGQLVIGWLIALVPYLIFSFHHPGALTERFQSLTYLFDDHLGIRQKVELFLRTYLSYLSPNYLLFSGDHNLRHHIGIGGELFVSVAILAIIGLIGFLFQRKWRTDRFLSFLFWQLLLSPVAASLTFYEYGSSALRSILTGLYLLLFALLGLASLASTSQSSWFTFRRVVISGLISLLILESFAYLRTYFTTYPAQTVGAFESYDFRQTLLTAIDQQPDDIVISQRANQPYAHLAFYQLTIEPTTLWAMSGMGIGTGEASKSIAEGQQLIKNIPVRVDEPLAKANRCLIYFPFDEMITNEGYYQPTKVVTNNFSRLTCFHDQINQNLERDE